MMKEPYVAVIITTYNNIADLKKAINSVEKSNYTNYFIVIADDGSSKTIQSSIINLYRSNPNIIITISKSNLGFPANANNGANEALKKEAELLFFINNDVVIDKNCIKELVKVFQDETVAIAGPKVYLGKTNRLNLAGGYFNWKYIKSYHRGGGEEDKNQYNKRERVEFIMGCALMIRAKLFEKFGRFDEKYFVYGDDEDLCYQALKQNYKIIYEPKAIAYHEHAKTIGKNSRLSLYHFVRNRLYFSKKYGNFKILILNIYWVFKTHYWRILKDFVKNNIIFFKAIIDFFKNRMGKREIKHK
ncbi:MAG: glycosyltransferase family 2 protein [Methanosarcinales archaeon]